MSDLDLFGRLMGVLVVLVLVLLAAWMLLRWMNKKMPGMGTGGNARLIRVLDRVAVSRTSSILLLRVQDKVFLVAITEHGAEKLSEFDDPDGTITPPIPQEGSAFSSILLDTAKRFVRKDDKNPSKSHNEDGRPQQ